MDSGALIRCGRLISNFSKMFEKLIYIQIKSFIESKLSKYQEGFRKNPNTQHPLLKMIENSKNKIWRSTISKGNKVGTIVMYISKVCKSL